MRACTYEQFHYQDIHPDFMPFDTPFKDTSIPLSSTASSDSDYFMIILLAVLLLLDDEEGGLLKFLKKS